MIQDRLFNSDGSFNYTLSNMDLMHGKQGDVILANGAVQPKLLVNKGMYRFRILNSSNGRFYRLALSNGKPFVQIGSDGGLLPVPVTRSSIDIVPGERVEVVIDFRSYETDTQIVLKNSLGFGRTADIMRFDVSGQTGYTLSIPSTPRPIERISKSRAKRTRTFTLGMNIMATGAQMFTINGLAYDHMRVDADPGLGTTEIWEFVNPMGMPHVVMATQSNVTPDRRVGIALGVIQMANTLAKGVRPRGGGADAAVVSGLERARRGLTTGPRNHILADG